MTVDPHGGVVASGRQMSTCTFPRGRVVCSLDTTLQDVFEGHPIFIDLHLDCDLTGDRETLHGTAVYGYPAYNRCSYSVDAEQAGDASP